jgi:lysophospholipase L1-like esterase
MRVLAVVLIAACGGGAHGSIDAPPGGDGHGGADASPQPTALVHLNGRFTRDADPRFEWPGSQIVTRTTDSSLAIRLDDSGNDRFEVWIDGALAAPIVATGGAHDYTIASGLAAGPHDIAVEKRTESFFGAPTYLGFPNANLVATPGPSRWIEFVGDSITCGYGVLGPNESECFSNDTEAETRGWAALTARAFGAAHSAIAYSGKGVYRNVSGDMTETMPILFERTLADDATAWGFTAYTPDLVVIDLGTNDFSGGPDPGQPFVAAYEAFVAQIRGHYPDAWILIAQSPMLSDGYPQGAMQRTKSHAYLNQVVDDRKAGGDAKIAYVEIDEQDGVDDGYGCDYHPSATTHMKMAAQLEAAIHAATGW